MLALTGVIIDIGTIEVWQAVVALLGVLGLSPAPWILGLALGRIQFTAPAERITDKRIADLKEQHVAIIDGKDERNNELKDSRDYYRKARLEERDRAEKVTDQLAEVAELAKLTTHLLASFDEATKDSTP